MEDIKLVKAEIERIRHHMDLEKKERQEDREILIDIKNVLVGNELNRGGLVKEIKEIKNEVDDLRKFKGEMDVYLKQAKFVIGGIIVAIISIGIKIFSK